MNNLGELRPKFDRLQRQALILGVGGMLVLAAGVMFAPQQFFESYLCGYMLWLGISLGCLGVLMLHHLVSGAWGHVIQRMIESGARNLLLMALLFVPILFGMHDLYPWTRHDVVEASHLLEKKVAYLNVPFFVLRAAAYFGFWIAFAYLLSRWSRVQDQTADPRLTRRMRILSAPGLVLFVLSVTFASVDWMMSLEPEWFSTIYGMQIIVGSVLGALAISIVVLWFLSDKKPFSEVLTTRHYHHLGNMLLAFTILWAYMAFSQYLIIWSGNLPEENFWYIRRLGTGWNVVAVILLIGHFFVPFLVLLSRARKRMINHLAGIAVFILVMRVVDLFWLISPAFNMQTVRLHAFDLIAPIGIGGLWIALFFRDLKGQQLLPQHDHRFTATAEYAHH